MTRSTDRTLPELEFVLAPGTELRSELLAEIDRVLASAEWKWYVEGENHRELPFLHLKAERERRTGAFDLFRPDGWIVDFKTHQIRPDQAAQKRGVPAADATVLGPRQCGQPCARSCTSRTATRSWS